MILLWQTGQPKRGVLKKTAVQEKRCVLRMMVNCSLFWLKLVLTHELWVPSITFFSSVQHAKQNKKKHSGLCNKIVTSNEFLIYICECICLCWSMAIKEMPVPITQKTLFTEFHKILAYLMLTIGLMNRVDLFFCKTFVNVCLNFYSHFFLNRLCALIDCSPIVNSNCLQSFTNVICVRFVDVYL